MESTDYDSQVQELVDGGHFDEAISILEMLEDALLKNKAQTLREVKMLKAEGLFKKKKYRQAMDLFNEDTDVSSIHCWRTICLGRPRRGRRRVG
ncbi:hypothetical protein LB505_005000 [Fusarium chuoi]|nr:hypothetical protein LB505_005000 [Fusarium chuoi]